ncbi:hypothetical protein GCM10023201_02280 [Actinomycetospora corticicola]
MSHSLSGLSAARASWSRLPDPWRSYSPGHPASAARAVAAVGGVAGQLARAGGRSAGEAVAASDPAAPPAAGGGRPGLVLCAISGRTTSEQHEEHVPDTVAGLWSPSFPSPELVDAAASMFPAIREEPGTLAEGPRWELTVGPGIFAVACRDWSRRERTEERARSARVKDVDAAVAAFVATGEWPERPTPRTAITSWSRKSRANMVRRLCELDYTPLYEGGRLPAMVTLTYPGDWLTSVPTGAVLKRHMKALRKRYARAWGEEWACVWKLEFQRRGAPHVHLLCTPPHGTARTTGQRFAVWLSAAWADVVAHPDPEQRRRHELAGTALDYADGLRATDPRRVAAYFTKHGLMAAKEYQHDVPPQWAEPATGPGRFWGVWTLQRAVRTVQVTAEDGLRAGRVARRWARAQGRVQTRWVQRVRKSTGRVSHRRSRSRVRLMTNGNRGWVAINDAPSFVVKLSQPDHSRPGEQTDYCARRAT